MMMIQFYLGMQSKLRMQKMILKPCVHAGSDPRHHSVTRLRDAALVQSALLIGLARTSFGSYPLNRNDTGRICVTDTGVKMAARIENGIHSL